MGNAQKKTGRPVFKPGSISSITPDAADIAVDLDQVPILQTYTAEERARFAQMLEIKTFDAGGLLIKQGDTGDGFYIIKHGSVKVTVTDSDGKSNQIGSLTQGDYFGEAALINNGPRAANVIAVDTVICFYLSREQFQKNFTNLQFAKRTAVSAETDNKEEKTYEAPADSTKSKTQKDVDLITVAVATNMIWSTLDAATMGQVIQEMHQEKIPSGKECIRQGDTQADFFYVVADGEFAVFVNGAKVGKITTGKCFGEAALLYNSPRKATVTATRDTTVWCIHRSTFRKIVRTGSSQQYKEYSEYLKGVSLLAPLSVHEREKIAEAIEEVSFEKGKVIFKQGEQGDAMYFVHTGQVSCVKNGEEVAVCSKGDYFGERALLKDDVRAADTIAKADTTCLKLDRQSFQLLLGPLEEVMHGKLHTYEKGPISAAPLKKTASETKTANIPFESLKVIGVLGKGSFGYVQLVKDASGKTYALKAVSKHMIVETAQQGHIMSEKKVIQQLKHPFLVCLHQTYKDRDRLYFLFEPVLGGELFTMLRAVTLFDEPTAMFYAACVLSAFEHMHSLDIVYRDLKPENLLVDKDGYIKITDFGFAKYIGSSKTFTLCGTPDYLAPEIVAGKGHGKGVDWWTLGILIYEMLASYPPFYQEDPMLTYGKILQAEPSYPAYFSKAAISILKKLLVKKRVKRLGVIKGGVKLIKKQPFFENLDFDELVAKKVKPPSIPKIKNDMDLSNFEDVADEEPDVCEPYQDPGTNWDADF